MSPWPSAWKHTLTIYRRAADGSFPKVQSLPGEAPTLTTPLLPDFVLSLEKLFRD